MSAVDVLAVMDADRPWIAEATNAAGGPELSAMRLALHDEARAAVAELIEAARQVWLTREAIDACCEAPPNMAASAAHEHALRRLSLAFLAAGGAK